MYTDDMAKANKDVQSNTRWNEDDLALVDAKAKRYGMNRSQWIKYASINAELTIAMQEEIRKPKL